MLKIYKNFWMTISMVFVSGHLMQSSQGTFHKNSFEKTLKISVMSKHFLEQVIVLQQNFLTNQQKCLQSKSTCSDMIRSVMQMNQSILQHQEISESLETEIVSLIATCKKYLYEQQESSFCEEKNQTLQAWWHFLNQACGQVQVQGYRQDFVWLHEQIIQLMSEMIFNHDLQQATIIRLISMCQELIQKFNGLLVNDYDFLVLANLTVFFVAIKC